MRKSALAGIAGISLLISTCAMAAEEERKALGAGVFLADDSEGFLTRRVAADYLFGAPSESIKPGMRFRQHAFSQGNWSRDAQQLLLIGSGKLDSGGSEWQGEAGLLHQGGRELLTVDATAHVVLSKRASAEVFVNRDYVETATALDRGIHATFAGGSMEYAFHPKLTGVALLGRQAFSDGNARNHGRLRLIFQPDLDLGLTLQLRYRIYASEEADVARAYFNPDKYRERMALAGWRKRGEGWTGSLLAGLGRQNVGGDGTTPTRLVEATFERSLEVNQALKLRAGYNRSASFGGPDYRYRYLQASWSLAF